MLHAGMLRPGIDVGRQTQLFNSMKPLKIRVLYDVIQEVVRYIDKAKDRIVDYLSLIIHIS